MSLAVDSMDLAQCADNLRQLHCRLLENGRLDFWEMTPELAGEAVGIGAMSEEVIGLQMRLGEIIPAGQPNRLLLEQWLDRARVELNPDHFVAAPRGDFSAILSQSAMAVAESAQIVQQMAQEEAARQTAESLAGRVAEVMHTEEGGRAGPAESMGGRIAEMMQVEEEQRAWVAELGQQRPWQTELDSPCFPNVMCKMLLRTRRLPYLKVAGAPVEIHPTVLAVVVWIWILASSKAFCNILSRISIVCDDSQRRHLLTAFSDAQPQDDVLQMRAWTWIRLLIEQSIPFSQPKISMHLVSVARSASAPVACHSMPCCVGSCLAVLLLTVMVLLHEISHAFAFNTFCRPSKRIVLHGLGGACVLDTEYLESLESRKRSKVLGAVALAGPLANAMLAVLGWAAMQMFSLPLLVHFFIDFWVVTNAAMAIFNMLPLTPLDGGKVFQGVFALCMSNDKAGLAVALLGLASLPAALFWLVAIRDRIDIVLVSLMAVATLVQAIFYIGRLWNHNMAADELRQGLAPV